MRGCQLHTWAVPALGISGPALIPRSRSGDYRRSLAEPLEIDVSLAHSASGAPAMVDVLRGLQGTIASQGEGFEAPSHGLVDAR